MAVNFTKDGNAIRVSIQGNKVIWLAVEDFMSAFTLNKLDNTVDIVAGKLTVNDVPIAELGLNGSYGIVTDQASLGAFIQFLTEVDADAAAAFSGDYNDLTNKPDLSGFATTTDLSTGLSGKQANLGFTPEDVANKQADLTASATKYPTVNAVNSGLSGKQSTLGYTAENAANKSTDILTDAASNTKYPGVKAIKDYVDLGAVYLIASKTNVDANTLASTTLDFATGRTLVNSVPTLMLMKYRSGSTSNPAAGKMKNDFGDMTAVHTLTLINPAMRRLLQFGLSSGLSSSGSGNLVYEITTIAGAACAFDVWVYGIAKPS